MPCLALRDLTTSPVLGAKQREKIWKHEGRHWTKGIARIGAKCFKAAHGNEMLGLWLRH